MRIIREPTVYLIGSQTTDRAEIDRFLADHDVAAWDTDTSVAGEKLAELAGRVCYMSFAKSRPGGNKAYLDRIRDSRVVQHLRVARLDALVRAEAKIDRVTGVPLVSRLVDQPPVRSLKRWKERIALDGFS